MTREQFHVGMRVRAIAPCCGLKSLVGKLGTIRKIVGGKTGIGVEFDEPFSDGHTLGGVLPGDNAHGRWCESESLEPFEGMHIVIDSDCFTTNIHAVVNGRVVNKTVRVAKGDTPNAYVGALMAMQKAFGIEDREAKRGEHVVVVRPMAAEGYTMGDILRMKDFSNGKNTRNGRLVSCYPNEYEVVRDSAIFQPLQRERKAVCIKAAPDDSPFREGRIYTVEGDGTIHTVCGKMQTYQQEDARWIAAGKNRFFIIDEDVKEG